MSVKQGTIVDGTRTKFMNMTIKGMLFCLNMFSKLFHRVFSKNSSFVHTLALYIAIDYPVDHFPLLRVLSFYFKGDVLCSIANFISKIGSSFG